jgi:hypothetical protein
LACGPGLFCFSLLHRRWRSPQAAGGPVIVWLRIGNTSHRALRAWIEPRLRGITRLRSHGSPLIEVI